MEIALAIIIGSIYGISFFLMLGRSMVKVILGVIVFSQGVNLLIFTASGLTRNNAPILSATADRLTPPFADPLPQALILTAIVISFGVLSFTLALMRKAVQVLDTDDLDQMKESD